MAIFIDDIGAPDIDFGSVCCIYQLLNDLKTKIHGSGAAAINLQQGETVVYYSFQNKSLPIFGGAKTDKSDIFSLSSFSKWRDSHIQRGMGFDFEKFMVWVRTDVMETIRQQYSQYLNVRSLVTIILTDSINFLTKIIYLIDATNDLIVSGGNKYSYVWVLIKQVTRNLFE